MNKKGWQSFGNNQSNMGFWKSLHMSVIKIAIGKASVIANISIEMEECIPGSKPIFADHVETLLLSSVEFVNIKNCRFIIRTHHG